MEDQIKRYKKLLHCQPWPKDVEETILKLIAELETEIRGGL